MSLDSLLQQVFPTDQKKPKTTKGELLHRSESGLKSEEGLKQKTPVGRSCHKLSFTHQNTQSQRRAASTQSPMKSGSSTGKRLRLHPATNSPLVYYLRVFCDNPISRPEQEQIVRSQERWKKMPDREKQLIVERTIEEIEGMTS